MIGAVLRTCARLLRGVRADRDPEVLVDREVTPGELHQAVLAVIVFLRENAVGHPVLAEMERAAGEIYDGSPRGAERFLGLSRGIADIWFSPANGNAPDDDTAKLLNARLGELYSAAYALAAQVERRWR